MATNRSKPCIENCDHIAANRDIVYGGLQPANQLCRRALQRRAQRRCRASSESSVESSTDSQSVESVSCGLSAEESR